MYAPELAATASALSVDWVAAIGPTLLLIIGGLASWFIRSRTEDLRAAEERLHEERRRIYVQVLEPYIKLFASIKSGDLAPVTKQMASYEYRKVSFELLLVGSDEVVKAYNALMTFSYAGNADASKQDPHEMIRLWGNLLLAIRKSVGSKGTKLESMDMLRGMITDADKLLH